MSKSIQELEAEIRKVEETRQQLQNTQKTREHLEVEKPQILAELQKIGETLSRLLPEIIESNPYLTKEAAAELINRIDDQSLNYEKILVTLTKALTDFAEFTSKYDKELRANELQREREKKSLDLLDSILQQYI